MVFSKEGASPDPAKVEAIKGVEPLCNAKELHSFLCIMQYNARLVESYAPVEGACILFTCVFTHLEFLKRLSRNMGPRQMDRNFQTLLRNKDSFIARSLLPGLRPMET